MNELLYEKIADGLVNDGYIVIKDALKEKLICALLYEAVTKTSYQRAGISNSESQHIDSSKRSDKTSWIDADKSTLSEYLEFNEGLRLYLNRSLYLGLTYYESHFAMYEEGDFYEKHLDTFVGEKNRVVTTLLYLNEEWSEEDEGELVIYDSEGKLVEKIMPKSNTMVMFLSDKFPHEVLPTKKKRHSIAGWFRVDKR